MPQPSPPARVLAIRIYPVKDEPGVDLDTVAIEPEGLAGDRRKKAAVHLVGGEDGPSTRSNLVLDLTRAELANWVGEQVTLGRVRLGVTRPAGNCPGVYAEVVNPGEVHVGDAVAVATRAPVRVPNRPRSLPS